MKYIERACRNKKLVSQAYVSYYHAHYYLHHDCDASDLLCHCLLQTGSVWLCSGTDCSSGSHSVVYSMWLMSVDAAMIGCSLTGHYPPTVTQTHIDQHGKLYTLSYNLMHSFSFQNCSNNMFIVTEACFRTFYQHGVIAICVRLVFCVKASSVQFLFSPIWSLIKVLTQQCSWDK